MRSAVGVLPGVLLALLLTLTAGAQTLTTLLTNGPSSNRINIVVLSEGFQSNELAAFLVDASNTVNYLLSSPPYSEYSNYFNAYAISVASAQSGSCHHTPTTTLVNTYFNSTFDSFGLQRMITIPPNNWDTNYADGQGKVQALLQEFMPEYDLAIMIVNDPQYGGAGGPVTITSINASMPEIALHESGHTFGGLTDEYTSAFPGKVPVEFPNATTQTNLASIKWLPWILTNTPVPTPANYTTQAGLFLGAEYQTNGWYRPVNNCKMNTLGIPFCPICAEQLVKKIHQAVSSFDGHVPASTNLSVSTTNALPFSIAPLQPATHNLSVQWFVNGTAAATGTNSSFTVLPQSLAAGANIVQAQIADTTALVRNDPSNVMTQTLTWNVNVGLGQLVLQNAACLGSGRFVFNVVGTATNGFIIQNSTDLHHWFPVFTNSIPASSFTYTNFTANTPGGQFFRAVAQ